MRNDRIHSLKDFDAQGLNELWLWLRAQLPRDVDRPKGAGISGIGWDDVGVPCVGGGSSGIQFDTDNEGGWLFVRTNTHTGATGGRGLDLRDTSNGINIESEGDGPIFITADGNGDVAIAPLGTGSLDLGSNTMTGETILAGGSGGVVISTHGDGDIVIDADSGGSVAALELRLSAAKLLTVSSLPTSDPAVAGAFWNDGGNVVLSGFTAGGVGIDFNKMNNLDAHGVDASYLRLQYIGSSPLTHTAYGGHDYKDLVYFNEDTGSGGQIIKNNGGGVIGFHNTGSGINATVLGGTGRLPHFDGPPVGGVAGPFVGLFMMSDGGGAVWLKNTGGPVILESDQDAILIAATGADINGTAVKVSSFDDFLIQGDQTITRSGTGVITAITPTNPTFRASPGNGPGGTNAVYLYNLPTSATGLTTGQIWNSSGVLHVV